MHYLQEPFDIPAEFRGKLKLVKPLDPRTNDEILDALRSYSPVTSEKNIWAFWNSGIDHIPPWCKRNIADWVRICGPEWNVHVLDAIPGSPNNFLNWVDSKWFPKSMRENSMGGSWSGQHTADLLRGPILHTYGGAFIDVSIVLLRTLDDYFWRELEDPNSPYEVFTPLCFDALVANNMVASRKGNIFMKAWHELFAQLWEDRTNADDIRLHPLVDPFQKALELPNVAKKGYTWDWRADVSDVMDYATQSLSWYRLAMVDGAGKETNWAQYAQDHVLYSDAWYEHYAANAELGFYGQQILDCLTTPLNADPESWEYKRAYKLIWKLLTSTSMIKGTTYTNLLATPELGALLNRAENQDKDIRPGTFGALLRYGSVHFEQTRKDMVRMKYTPLAVFNKALFEVFEV